eukprot:5643110-Amphidinium_carterae.1
MPSDQRRTVEANRIAKSNLSATTLNALQQLDNPSSKHSFDVLQTFGTCHHAIVLFRKQANGFRVKVLVCHALMQNMVVKPCSSNR